LGVLGTNVTDQGGLRPSVAVVVGWRMWASSLTWTTHRRWVVGDTAQFRIRAIWAVLQTERGVRLQLSATLVGGVTAAVLLLFLFGEVAGGDLSGLAHVIQVVPLVALLLLGWWRPGLAGALLLAAGGALAVAYFVESSDSVEFPEQLLVAALFLLPPMLAGTLFLIAGRSRHQLAADRGTR